MLEISVTKLIEFLYFKEALSYQKYFYFNTVCVTTNFRHLRYLVTLKYSCLFSKLYIVYK